MTIYSPSTVGRVATRMSSMRPAAAALSEMRPSCGLRRSAMSIFASTFRRVVTPGDQPLGDPLHLVEHAVDPEADEERVLLRLEVDVGGAVLGGLEDHGVDEADERRVRDAVVDLEVVVSSSSAASIVHARRRPAATRAPNASESRTSLRSSARMSSRGGDAELDRVARGEPELVDRRAGWPGRRSRRRSVSPRSAYGMATTRSSTCSGMSRAAASSTLGEREVDERKLVAGGERAGDAVARRRRPPRRAPARRSPSGRARPRTTASSSAGTSCVADEQVGDELGELVDAVLAAERRAQTAARRHDGAEDGGFLAFVAHPIPRSRYRHADSDVIRGFGR